MMANLGNWLPMAAMAAAEASFALTMFVPAYAAAAAIMAARRRQLERLNLTGEITGDRDRTS